MIDYKAADFWLRFAQVIGYVLLGAWVYISNRQKATAREVKAIETKTVAEIKAIETKTVAEIKAVETKTVAEINALEAKLDAMEKARVSSCGNHVTRTTTLEAQIQNALTPSDLGVVYERINGVQRGVDDLTGLLKGLRDNVNLLVDHHLRGAKK